MRTLKGIISILLAAIIFSCCKKNDAGTSSSNTYNAYFPLKIGHVLTYRLDSTVTTNFEAALVVHSYLLRDSIVGTSLDNNNNTVYTIYRSITDTAGKQPWQPLSTYAATPFQNRIEVTEDNNLRYVKLVTPVTSGYSWNGNTYIYIPPNQMVGNLLYPNNMSNWMYTYRNVNQPYTVNNTYDSSVVVFQNADSVGTYPTTYYQKSIENEVYAKNIGMIYKKFYFVIWQPQRGNWNSGSFGIELKLVSYK